MEVNKNLLLWEWPIRLFHWLLVAAISTACLSVTVFDVLFRWHLLSASIIAGLLVFRLAWAVIGYPHSHFSGLLAQLLAANTGYHSRLGILSIFILLTLTTLQFITGLFMRLEDEEFTAPLHSHASPDVNQVMMLMHVNSAYVLLVFITAHILAVTYISMFRDRAALTRITIGQQVMTDDYPTVRHSHLRLLTAFLSGLFTALLCLHLFDLTTNILSF